MPSSPLSVRLTNVPWQHDGFNAYQQLDFWSGRRWFWFSYTCSKLLGCLTPFGTRTGPTSFPYLDILSPYNLATDPQDPGFRFQMTFWAIVRSPLFIGLDLSGDLTAADLAQLTNPGVLAVNSHSTNNRQVKSGGGSYVWAAEQVSETSGYYVALLNHGTQAQEVRASFAEIGIAGSPDECDVVDVWTGQAQGTAAVAVVAHLPAVTGARLLWLKDCR